MPRARPATSASEDSLAFADLDALVHRLMAHAPYEGVFDLRLPGVFVSRASWPNQDLHHAVQRPALCLVAQGAKRVMLGQEIYAYDASRMLVYSVDVPVAAQVTVASPEKPYLGIRLDLDPLRISELTARVFPHGLPNREEGKAICVGQADVHVLDAVARLVGLASQPGEADLLAPLVVDEILIRLLRSPLGHKVALIGQEESKLHRIAKAVTWVRTNFDQPLDVERLAGMVHMSVSTFHQHFKTVTTLSPLQFQKALRLQEARRLMVSRMMDAGMAGHQVGYASPSQFSREYSRYFGLPPTKDAALLRGDESSPNTANA